MFRKQFIMPHMKHILHKWKCSECDKGIEAGMSYVGGNKVDLCMDCVRDLKEAIRP